MAVISLNKFGRWASLPLRSLAVFNSSALTSSVNSILLPPRILFLEHYTTPGQFSFRKSLSECWGHVLAWCRSGRAVPGPSGVGPGAIGLGQPAALYHRRVARTAHAPDSAAG